MAGRGAVRTWDFCEELPLVLLELPALNATLAVWDALEAGGELFEAAPLLEELPAAWEELAAGALEPAVDGSKARNPCLRVAVPLEGPPVVAWDELAVAGVLPELAVAAGLKGRNTWVRGVVSLSQAEPGDEAESSLEPPMR